MRIVMTAVVVCITVCIGWFDVYAQAPDTTLPVYRCMKIEREIQLTGRLDDPLWQQAPVVTLLGARGGALPRQTTEVRLLYSGTMLYIGYHCVDDYIWGTLLEYDDHVYNEECVEVFLSPAHAFHHYYEINISPANVVYEACIINARWSPDHPDNMQVLTDFTVPGMKSAVHVEGTLNQPGKGRSWNVEYAIPFTELIGAPTVPPAAGDTWLMNLYRIDRPNEGRTEGSAWSFHGLRSFHTPWRFGTLKFE